MKIWLIKDNEPLPLSGESPRLFRMGIFANYLAKAGHDVTWWTSDFNHFTKSFIASSKLPDETTLGYKLKVLHGPGYKKNISIARLRHNMAFAGTLKKALNQATEKPDIILASLPTPEPCALAVRFGKKHAIPVLVDLRDMWPDIMLLHFKKWLRPFVRLLLTPKYRMTRRLLRQAKGLIGITEPFLNWGLSYAARESNEFDKVIHFSYQPEALVEESSRLTSFQHCLEDKIKNKRVISFVGSLNDNRLPEVIDAIKAFSDSLVLFIAGTGKHDDELKKQAGDAVNIHFLGWLNKAEIKVLLEKSHFGLIPYLARVDFLASIPSKVAEYLSEGVILFSLLGGHLAEFIDKKQVGFHHEELTGESLNYLLKRLATMSNDTLENYKKRARLAFKECFAEDVVLDSLNQHLEFVVNQKNLVRGNYDLSYRT